MTNRRRFLKSAVVPALGTMLPATDSSAGTRTRDFFKELGVRPVINAEGALTALTGSLMLPEAAAAWDSVSRKFVRLDELHNAVGQKITNLVQSEAAMVCSGAAGALVVGTTQEFISNMLGGRRESVTVAAGTLQNCGLDPVFEKSYRDPRSQGAGGGHVRVLQNCKT